MKALPVVLLMSGLLWAEQDAPHIKAALSAYQGGVSAERDQSIEKAIGLFLKAVEIEPTFMDARYALIDAYQKKGNPLEAAAAITQLLEIEPSASKYRLLLAQLLLDEKQPERALAQFSYLLRLDPYNADGLLGFASAAQQMGMEQRALDAIELGIRHYPQDERFKNWPSKR